MVRSRAVLALVGLLVALGAEARAQEAIKDAATAEERLAALTRSLADRHVAFARKIEKKHPHEAWDELLLALALQEDHKAAREKLGYKKEGERWLGAPEAPPPGAPLDAALAKERDKDRRDAASKLAALAKRVKLGGLDPEGRRIAGLALEENPDERLARDLLGHEKKGEAWLDAREHRIRAAFLKALAQAREGEEGKADPTDAALEALVSLGRLHRRETAHAVVLATATAPELDRVALARALEATWAAYRYYVAGETAGFSVDGEPKREATGARPAPASKARWLVVGPDPEHERYVEHVVPDRKQHAFAKGLQGYTSRVALGGDTALIVLESRFTPSMRVEWATSGMAEFLCQAPLPQKAKAPGFVAEGLKRFFGGHVSGRADVFYSSAGSSTSKRSFSGGSLDALRATVRGVLQGSPEGDLRSLLAKGTNELERPDSAKALAFVDWCLARRRGELATFLSSLKPEEAPLATFEAAFKSDVDAVEREFRAWVRESY